VTVHASADEIARRIPYAAGALGPIDAHRCTYRAADQSLEWLAVRIAMLGAEVVVHESPELRAALGELAERLRRASGEASSS
jgi:hypothetical protein